MQCDRIMRTSNRHHRVSSRFSCAQSDHNLRRIAQHRGIHHKMASRATTTTTQRKHRRTPRAHRDGRLIVLEIHNLLCVDFALAFARSRCRLSSRLRINSAPYCCGCGWPNQFAAFAAILNRPVCANDMMLMCEESIMWGCVCLCVMRFSRWRVAAKVFCPARRRHHNVRSVSA